MECVLLPKFSYLDTLDVLYCETHLSWSMLNFSFRCWFYQNLSFWWGRIPSLCLDRAPYRRFTINVEWSQCPSKFGARNWRRRSPRAKTATIDWSGMKLLRNEFYSFLRNLSVSSSRPFTNGLVYTVHDLSSENVWSLILAIDTKFPAMKISLLFFYS